MIFSVMYRQFALGSDVVIATIAEQLTSIVVKIKC